MDGWMNGSMDECERDGWMEGEEEKREEKEEVK